MFSFRVYLSLSPPPSLSRCVWDNISKLQCSDWTGLLFFTGMTLVKKIRRRRRRKNNLLKLDSLSLSNLWPLIATKDDVWKNANCIEEKTKNWMEFCPPSLSSSLSFFWLKFSLNSKCFFDVSLSLSRSLVSSLPPSNNVIFSSPDKEKKTFTLLCCCFVAIFFLFLALSFF